MFRELATLQDRMNRLFDEGFVRNRPNQDDSLYAGTWLPAVDIYEDDHKIVLKADLPDIDPADVDIRIEDSTLFLKGERKFEKEVNQENFHRIERAYGTFARSFVLPRTVAADKIAAEYKSGVLVISMPKREESKPKQIKVNVNS
jgi:HSP20 family protein